MTEAGLRAVFLSERGMLLRLVTARLGSAANAEDVLQDMWLKLEGLPSGPIAHPAAYLFRMAANLALDRRRSEIRRAVREASWQDTQPDGAELPNAETALLARERLAHVEAALAALPERVGEVFRLYRFEGLPQKAIAQRLDISLSLVEKLLQRAYRAIHDAGRRDDAGLPASRRLPRKETRL